MELQSMNMPLTSEANIDKSRALGEFLRAARERQAPEDFGLPKGLRRRTRGLRREEVATLCGISPTWYTWIEQGRTTAISVATLVDLALGLRLTQAERAYLFQLADRADPAVPGTKDSDISQYEDLVSAIRSPAYVLDRHWNALAWNPPAAALFRDWLPSPSGDVEKLDRNLLRYVFLHPAAQTFIVDWEERARRIVAEYRADSASLRNDPVHQVLVDELCLTSPSFNRAWSAQTVLGREGGIRSFLRPDEGKCTYQQFTLRMAQQNEVKLIILHLLETS